MISFRRIFSSPPGSDINRSSERYSLLTGTLPRRNNAFSTAKRSTLPLRLLVDSSETSTPSDSTSAW